MSAIGLQHPRPAIPLPAKIGHQRTWPWRQNLDRPSKPLLLKHKVTAGLIFSLPRGLGAAVDVPLATAECGTPQAVERLSFRGVASLFRGAIPASENWTFLQSIDDEGGAVQDAAAGLIMPPVARSKLCKQLERR